MEAEDTVVGLYIAGMVEGRNQPMALNSGFDNVRQLHAIPQLPEIVAREVTEQAARLLSKVDLRDPEFPAGVEVVRSWAPRIALIVSTSPSRTVLETLRARDIHPVAVDPSQAEDAAARVSPFIFMLVGTDALTSDAAVDTIRAAHRWSPSARPLLMAADKELTNPVLLRAMRAGILDALAPDSRSEIDQAVSGGLLAAGAGRERVLAIGAHPDDVEIGCAGTLLDHRRRGDRISILTLSRGAVGGETARRVAEATTTASAMGAQLLLGDLPDTEISDGIETIRLIEGVVRALNPTVVYVHSAHDNHQDHRAIASATVTATRGVRRVFAYQSPSATNAFAPTQFVAVDDVIQRKVAILGLFDSQAGRSYLEPEMVIAGCRYWARHLAASARYAEPFEVIRSIGDLRQASSAPATALAHAPLSAIAALIPDGLEQAHA